MKNKTIGTSGIIIALVFFTACSNSSSNSSSQPTSENIQLEISRALVANNITGCGEMEWYPVPDQRHEYKVKCSSDGKNWRVYRVWSKINKVYSDTNY